jgi:alpha-L-fucosidase 2
MTLTRIVFVMILITHGLIFGCTYSAGSDREPLVLRYNRPATNWEKEALPIGNGRLGGMIFGGVDREHIQFNEDSLWIGDEKDTGAYQAFGDLYIEFGATARTVGVSNPSRHQTSRGQEVNKTVDGKIDTKWCMEHEGRPVIWETLFPDQSSIPLQSYTFTSAGDVPTRDPQKWQLFGSNDGDSWTLLDERGLDGPFEKRRMSKRFTFKNEKQFKSYRFVFQHMNKTHFQVAEIALGEPGSAFRQTLETPAMGTYERTLNLDTAIQTVRYKRKGTTYRRTYFSSYPAQVMVLRFTADKPGAHTGRIVLADAHKGKIAARGNRVTSSGSLEGYVYSGGSTRGKTNQYDIALQYEAQVLVRNEGGTLEASEGAISFRNCDNLTVLLAAGTDYLNQRDKGWKGEHPHKRITAQLAAVVGKSFDALRTEHIKDYQGLFDRCALDLGETPEPVREQPTDKRLAAYKKGETDVDLEELLFQYARYLMISSSRPGTLPANLQGMWNQSNRPPWRSDYHTDVNIQMNYWFVDAANLSPCFQPLAEWLYSIRGVRRDETKKTFQTRGWISHAENGIFGGSTWKWSKGDAAWAAQNLWDHYAFTQDKEYLRTRAYPIMKELCEFWEDHLKELPDGTLVSPDGFSPEHGPHEDGVSFDQQLVWDLFTNYMEAAQALEVDLSFCRKVASMRRHLLGPKIGKWGQLQEWMVDRDDPKDQHRHLSHLIAVHPGRQISPLTTPKFAEAAKVSMNARGDGATGWSKAWKVNIWARLHDGNRTYKLINELIRGNITDNLFDTHPPFQIDGNFGYASGVCEMLVQSHLGEIHLLPALPDAWPNGYVKGLCARGGFEVDISWEKGQLKQTVIKSKLGNSFRIRYQDKVITQQIEKGKAISLNSELSQ